MSELIVISSKDYENDGTTNYGDCIIINDGIQLVVFDCGTEAHADRVIKYAKANGYKKLIGIISHADSDHVDGFHKLHDEGYLDKLYTTLLFKNKYINKILKYLDDKRRGTESTRKNIEEKYSNISAMSGYGLKDTYDDDFKFVSITTNIKIIGPDIDYLIQAVGDNIDKTGPDSVDGNTLVNAASIIVKVTILGKTFILDGDASVKSIIDSIGKLQFNTLQLSHHGNKDRKELLEKYEDACDYFISDNTGSSNGGSANLDVRGYRCKNTLKDGDLNYNTTLYYGEGIRGRALGK